MRPETELSVIVVNYCRWASTLRLVGQLRAADSLREGSAEVVVVDNHSPPHPHLRRLRRTEGVSLRRWGRNFGFAPAVNEGARLSLGRWLLLLNPDITVDAGFLNQAQVLCAGAESEVGVIGLSLRNADGSVQPSTGPVPTLMGTLARLALPRAWRKYHLLRKCERSTTPWSSGCALLIRRKCFERIGGLDPRFFLYYEDVDFCLRARDAGWRVMHEPRLSVRHHHPLASRGVSPWLRVVTRHALMTFAERHWPAWQCRWLHRIIRTEMRLRRWKARRKGLSSAQRIFERGELLVEAMRQGEEEKAQRILRRLARCENARQHRRAKKSRANRLRAGLDAPRRVQEEEPHPSGQG